MSKELGALLAAAKQLQYLERLEAFDPEHVDTRPNAKQLEVIKDFGNIKRQYVVAGNQSGKTVTAARIVSWFLLEKHPYWTRPRAWANENLQVIVCGRTNKIIEEVIWRKMRPYFEQDQIREVRGGGILQKIEIFLPNGRTNEIIFVSFENEMAARERVQGFSCHLLWIDEMPKTTGFWDECHKRVIAKDGFILTTFTPLTRNSEIRKTVDASQAPHSKKYQFHMFDNPIYQDPIKKAGILKDMENMPAALRETRLSGAWSSGDNAVYFWDESWMQELPFHYGPNWRHMELSDPATESAFGLVIIAEDPKTGLWWTVKAKYLTGIYVPAKIFETVMKETRGLNIVKRVSDPAATWYIHTANAEGISYECPFDKNSRKAELIAGLQGALGTRLLITPECSLITDEISTCHKNDNGKIINGHKFHLLDCLQYGVDLLPKWDGPKEPVNWHQALREANEVRKKAELNQKKSSSKGRVQWKIPSSGRFFRRSL